MKGFFWDTDQEGSITKYLFSDVTGEEQMHLRYCEHVH